MASPTRSSVLLDRNTGLFVDLRPNRCGLVGLAAPALYRRDS